MRTIQAARYVVPLREGSSVPALVECDDLGIYVVKLRAAGQGSKALVAELVAGELARSLGLRVPEIVLVELDRRLAESEPDPELSMPLESSAGLNLGMDYLPGSITFDPVVGPAPDAATASDIVLFDAFVMNVDRSPRNPNLLLWHGRPWLIDHGAALYFHHGWRASDSLETSRDPFEEIRDHVLLPWATDLAAAAARMQGRLTDDLLVRIARQIPLTWLSGDRAWSDAEALLDAYASWLTARLAALPIFLTEAQRAHALRV
jgi:hypothetical protein